MSRCRVSGRSAQSGVFTRVRLLLLAGERRLLRCKSLTGTKFDYRKEVGL